MKRAADRKKSLPAGVTCCGDDTTAGRVIVQVSCPAVVYDVRGCGHTCKKTGTPRVPVFCLEAMPGQMRLLPDGLSAGFQVLVDGFLAAHVVDNRRPDVLQGDFLPLVFVFQRGDLQPLGL